MEKRAINELFAMEGTEIKVGAEMATSADEITTQAAGYYESLMA